MSSAYFQINNNILFKVLVTLWRSVELWKRIFQVDISENTNTRWDYRMVVLSEFSDLVLDLLCLVPLAVITATSKCL